MPTTFRQRLQSLLYPVRIRKGSGMVNPVLELFYYRGRYILCSDDAVYSDGAHYRPLVAAFTSSVLKPLLPSVRKVLVLGTGLASAVHVLYRYGCHPHFTLVDLDALVLQWAMEFLPAGAAANITPACADAFDFMEKDYDYYDLIVVDVFKGREVPEPVTNRAFLAKCKARLHPQGHLVLNYIVNRQEDTFKAKAALEAAFSEVTEISFDTNRVYIATA